MLSEIPLALSIPHFTQHTEIGGKTYAFEFEWLERGAFWLMHIYDDVGEPLVLGVKLVEDWPLLRRDMGIPFELFVIAKADGPCLLVNHAV